MTIISVVFNIFLKVKYTKKVYRVLIIGFIFVLLSKTSPAEAAVIFSDSFQGGYNTSFWSVPSWAYPPISSDFGIKVDPQHNTSYSSLQHISSLTGDFIVKFDMKIDSLPASDVGIEFRDATGKWKLVEFYGIAIGGTANTIIAKDIDNFGVGTTSWSPTVNDVHHIEVSISPDAHSAITVKDNAIPILNWQSSVGFTATSIEIDLYGVGSEVANFQLCDADGCTNPTPTPTIPVTKVVVIPGFGGSWNADAILRCRPSTDQDTWTSWSGANPVYTPIISSLNDSGFTAKPFYYDWRKQIPDITPLLTKFINDAVVPQEKVYIVGHSMGGLVGSAYIQQEGGHNKADKYMSVGAPHQGTLLSYPAWSGGEMYGTLPMRIAATIAIRKCKDANPRLSNREIIQQFFPSIQNLLPTFDYLKDIRTRRIKPVADMLAKNNWLPTDGLFTNTKVGTLSGYGFDTLRFFGTLAPSRRDEILGNWRDGRPARREFVGDGDGTVLQMSNQLSGADNRLLPKNHTELISSSEGIDEILRFLTAGRILRASRIQETFTEPKTALVIIGYPGNFSIATNGQTIQDKNGTVVLFDPKPGAYNFKLLPQSPNTEIIVVQFLEGNKTFWKSYQWKSRLPKLGDIKFDPTNPIEDALK